MKKRRKPGLLSKPKTTTETTKSESTMKTKDMNCDLVVAKAYFFEGEGGEEFAIIEPEEAEMRTSFDLGVEAVEKIVRYRFRNKALLEEALTHSSYTDSSSYQRLEFVGDAVLGLAIANFVFITYPDLDQGHLSLLRSANVSTEKLARVAVRHGLFRYVRHIAPSLELKVEEFAQAVKEEGDDMAVHFGGLVKAPKVLADIVESIAAAIYVDCNFDLKLLWDYFSHLLEPIVTLETLQQQPVTQLYELCQKHGKQVDIKHWRKGAKDIANVFVDGKLMGSGCSEQKDIAKINAVKEALEALWKSESIELDADTADVVIWGEEIEGAKQKLNEFCIKKRWPKPVYRMEKEAGPSHDKRFIYSVHIETRDGTYVTVGDMKLKVREAENSAASNMLYGLQDSSQPMMLIS